MSMAARGLASGAPFQSPPAGEKPAQPLTISQRFQQLYDQTRLTQDAKPRKGGKVLNPVFANAGIEADYRKRLIKLVDKMQDSIMYWLESAYRNNPPEIAQDALPAAELRKAIRKLSRRWQKQFNALAPDLARYFSQAVHKRSDKALQRILAKGGMAVEFKMTPAMRDIIQATVTANVSLIKSIPQRYFTQIEGMVMRSVQKGGDLKQLTTDLRKEFRVSKRRAALIARDQNAKATGSLVRARQIELGLTRAIWLHSGGGKHPRPTHVRNNGKEYDVIKGWWDPSVKKRIHPGELINCKCTNRAIVEGLS